MQPIHTDHSYFQYPPQPPRSYDRPQSILQSALQSNACIREVNVATPSRSAVYYPSQQPPINSVDDNSTMMVGCSPGYLDAVGVYRPRALRAATSQLYAQPAYSTQCYHSCCGSVGHPQYLGEYSSKPMRCHAILIPLNSETKCMGFQIGIIP